MQRETASLYRCPYTGEALVLESPDASGDLGYGRLHAGGRAYPIQDGIPHLIDWSAESFSPEEEREHAYYQATSDGYDAVMDWVFKSFHESEEVFRGKMIDMLELRPGNRVLETGAGTCRDSVHIGQRVGPTGGLFVQGVLAHAVDRSRAAGQDRRPTADRVLRRQRPPAVPRRLPRRSVPLAASICSRIVLKRLRNGPRRSR